MRIHSARHSRLFRQATLLFFGKKFPRGDLANYLKAASAAGTKPGTAQAAAMK
jgi:hypothetical protein